MQSLRRCVQLLSLHGKSVLKPQILTSNAKTTITFPKLYNTTALNHKWEDYNKHFFPIQGPNEPRRPAYVCHSIKNVKYSPKKMWYVASFIRGMSIDEALKQLSFLPRKGAIIVKDVLLEAQKLAVEEHNVEFKSNLWVAESMCGKGVVIKGARRHAKGRRGVIHYRHCNYYVRLEEGKPPEHYYLPYPKSGDELLQDWLKKKRERKITNSL